MFSLRPVLKSLALFVFLAPSLSVFAEQEDENSAQASLSDDVTDDSSLMTNYNAMREEGQGFYLKHASSLFERPDTEMTFFYALHWWCDLDFSFGNATNNYGYDDADTVGYVGRGVQYVLGSSLENILADGAQIPNENRWPVSVSAVMVPTLGIFEGQFHATHDDWSFRYWDDGSSTWPVLGWEGHDEGDMSPNSDTSAYSASGPFTKITPEEAAKVLGMDVVDMTPATCSKEYKAAWDRTHVPDPINTSLTDLEENVAELQADNKELMSEVAKLKTDINELMSRMAATEGSLTASGSGGDGDGVDTTSTSSPPFMAWYKHDTMDNVMKSMMTVAVIIGLVAVDFM